MNTRESVLEERKRIALVAHDNRKGDLVEWVKFNRGTLEPHDIYATGTTDNLLENEFGIKVNRLQSACGRTISEVIPMFVIGQRCSRAAIFG